MSLPHLSLLSPFLPLCRSVALLPHDVGDVGVPCLFVVILSSRSGSISFSLSFHSHTHFLPLTLSLTDTLARSLARSQRSFALFFGFSFTESVCIYVTHIFFLCQSPFECIRVSLDISLRALARARDSPHSRLSFWRSSHFVLRLYIHNCSPPSVHSLSHFCYSFLPPSVPCSFVSVPHPLCRTPPTPPSSTFLLPL